MKKTICVEKFNKYKHKFSPLLYAIDVHLAPGFRAVLVNMLNGSRHIGIQHNERSICLIPNWPPHIDIDKCPAGTTFELDLDEEDLRTADETRTRSYRRRP